MLGQSISELYASFIKLKDLFGFNVCGEGGEYESIVLDSPLFMKTKIEMVGVETITL